MSGELFIVLAHTHHPHFTKDAQWVPLRVSTLLPKDVVRELSQGRFCPYPHLCIPHCPRHHRPLLNVLIVPPALAQITALIELGLYPLIPLGSTEFLKRACKVLTMDL